MSLTSIITHLLKSPKKLFLIDAIGALITALSLSLLLVQFQTYFGMPVSVLYVLAGIAAGLCFYSFSIYKFVESNFSVYLILLICLNSLYCIISLAFLFIHFNLLTQLGIVYFILELLIISGLIFIEGKIYRHLRLKG